MLHNIGLYMQIATEENASVIKTLHNLSSCLCVTLYTACMLCHNCPTLSPWYRKRAQTSTYSAEERWNKTPLDIKHLDVCAWLNTYRAENFDLAASGQWRHRFRWGENLQQETSNGAPWPFRNTYIEAIMGHIWRHCNIIVTHCLVDVLIVFDEDSLWPHVLFCPTVQRDTAESHQGWTEMLRQASKKPRVLFTCAEERWSRGRGLLSASSLSELQLCEAGHNIEEATNASWVSLTCWWTPEWTARKTSACPHTVCSEGKVCEQKQRGY